MKLVRIALWIGFILSILPLALFVPLRNYFKIDLGLWGPAAALSCTIFEALLIVIWKPQKTDGSPSNGEETT
jgi:hypothetical protein